MAWHGYGIVFGGFMNHFASGVAQMGFPFPEFFAWAAALSEFAGGILVIVGLATRFGALMIFATMGVAFFIHHAPDPFSKKELAFLFWAFSGALMLTGAGKFSLDGLFCSKERSRV